MMIVRDPIHGIISLTEEEKDLLNAPLLSRLRWIRQTSLAFYVYPGLTHSRFEHSIGTMYIAGKMASPLSWDVRKARLWGLLHDVGHPAFSHDGELALQLEGLSKGHEAEGERLLREHYPELWRELRGAKEEVLISFALGADRMDYLRRDSYHAGVPYGVVEQDYLIKNLVEVGPGEIGVREKAVEAVESFLIARFHMFTTVYIHKTARIASAMLIKALRLALRQGLIGKEDFYTMGDEALLYSLAKQLPIAKALYERRLYKKWKELEGSRELWEELAELSLEAPFVAYYIPSIVKHYSLKVKVGERLKPLHQLSSVSSMLRRAERKRIGTGKILLAVEEGKREEVEQFLREAGFRL